VGNHSLANAKTAVTDASELTAGRLLGPLSPLLAQLVHTSPMGAGPQVPSTWQVLADCGPFQSSVN
jgi:hypothetical protein